MTDEQIIELVKEHFQEGGIRDDGGCCEWFATTDAILKFARMIYNKGRKDEIMQQPKMCYVNDQLIISD